MLALKIILKFPGNNENIARKGMVDALRQVDKSAEWDIHVAGEGISKVQAVRLIEFWHPQMCIVNNDELPADIFSDIPTVFTHRDPSTVPSGATSITYDEKAVGELAARHLLSLHLPSYAFVPSPGNEFWSKERQRHFIASMGMNGYGVSVFGYPPGRADAAKTQTALSDWLKSIPRPIGIFAANDPVALQLVTVCRRLGIAIPDEVAVLGVDNRNDICESSNPSISSILFDLAQFRRLMFENIRRIAGRKLRSCAKIGVKPAGIITRTSTLHLNRRDEPVFAALDLIRTQACLGLTAGDVAKTFPCSRRSAEIRFRTATGKTIHAAIQEIRMDKVRQLSTCGGHSTDFIASQCGYRSRSGLFRLTHATQRFAKC